MQVHGGMGFIEETGAAQHLRDARIAPIYEGTNGIQAIDLVTRKLPLSGGETVRAQIAAMRAIVDASSEGEHAGLRRHRAAPARCHREPRPGDEPSAARRSPRNAQGEALAGATPYLRLFALAQGGAALAEMALAANAQAAAGDSDPAHAGRIALCRFFAENIAVGAKGLEDTVHRAAPASCRMQTWHWRADTMSLNGKTLFITGASRGIGLAIGLRAARDGANVVIAAKTAEPHPKLPGTIYTAAEEIEAAGGKALPLVVDVRDEEAVKGAIDRTVETFGGLDIVVNNASAISLTPTPQTDMKRFDLMHQINTRGTFMVSKYAIPHLEKAENPHILMLSPPLDMSEKWFAPHLAYSLAKYGMSLCVLGLAGELRAKGIAVNALWPRTTIATSAIRNLLGGDALVQASRTPEILADAAYAIFQKPAKSFTGHFLIDDVFLSGRGRHRFREVPGRSVRAPGARLLRAGRHAAPVIFASI